jgi:hypothetical protein
MRRCKYKGGKLRIEEFLVNCDQERRILQLDWPSKTDTNKINLPQNREGYDKSETAVRKLSSRRIFGAGTQASFSFLAFFYEN